MKLVKLSLPDGNIVYVNQDTVMMVGQAVDKAGAVVVGVAIIEMVNGRSVGINMPPGELAEYLADSVMAPADEPKGPTTISDLHR